MLFRGLLLLVCAGVFAGCSSSEKIDTSSAEGAYKLAEKYEKDERYEEAVVYFSEVKNKHPYSRFATDAELRIADIEYKRENFAEAESGYKLFKDFHPDNDKIDFVTFRIGMSILNQMPPTTDRDLALANDAIRFFDEVITNYPNSPHAKEAKEQREKAVKMLADKELYIAEYYFKRKKYQSALGRFEDVLRSYPNLGHDVRSLYGATISAYNIKDLDKAKMYLKRLIAEYPNSKELRAAREELADGF